MMCRLYRIFYARFWVLCLCLGLGWPLGVGAMFTEAPQLRIDTTMHTASIRAIDTDAQGRLAITASYDKTARLWDVDTGDLLRVLRVPQDHSRSGELWSAALSPDGQYAVVGGWTDDVADQYTVYVFATATGELVQRVAGFANVIYDLEFSADGRYLAVATGGRADLGIIDTRRWQRIQTLCGYGDSTPNVAWSVRGWLATASLDGRVRVYGPGPEFHLLHEWQPDGGAHPFGVAFDPAGRRLAVGFEDSARVQVFDAQTMDLLYEPEHQGVEGSLATPVWSVDGRVLFAAGSALQHKDGQWQRIVRAWREGGRGVPVDWGVAGNALSDLKSLPDGGLLAGSLHPDLTRLSAQGQMIWQRQPEHLILNYRDLTHLRLTDQATDLGFQPSQQPPLRFLLTRRQLLNEASSATHFQAQGQGMVFSHWRNQQQPRLNDQPLDWLHAREISRSVDVAAHQPLAILGTNAYVYGVDARGQPRFRQSGYGTAWAVKLAAQAPVFVVAYEDGTLRWHHQEDGRELLALFVHSDRERWVLWTPDGYYDAAPGGERLIGWHVNRGLEQAPDFFPLAVFRERYYRPDLIQALAQTWDESRARAQIAETRQTRLTTTPMDSQHLPPVVRILSPGMGEHLSTTQVILELQLNAPVDAPVTQIEVRVNGRPQLQSQMRGLQRLEPGDGTQRLALDLSAVSGSSAMISVQARNRYGYGPVADVEVGLSGPEFMSFSSAPKLYGVAIGVSRYQDRSLNLMFAAKDAEDVAALWRAQAGGLYREVEVRVLTNREATLEAIRDSLEWLEQQVTAQDVAKIFIAGHGINDNTGQFYFTPHDVEIERLRRTALPGEEIVRTIAYLQGRVLYFMDACHAGNVDVIRRSGISLDLNRHIQDLSAAEIGAVVFSSAAGSQYALESPRWGNGAFTRALLDGLAGAADYNQDGAVSVNELSLYVSQTVKELTNNQQTPVMQKPGAIRDFPIAIVGDS